MQILRDPEPQPPIHIVLDDAESGALLRELDDLQRWKVELRPVLRLLREQLRPYVRGHDCD